MPSQIRVLIVENEPGVAQTLARALELSGGSRYAVDVCFSAEAALARLAAAGATDGGCDVILTDLELGGMDGRELLLHVRALNPRPRSILMTGHGAPRLASFVDCPAEGYLLKPFGLQDFLDVVERVTRDTVYEGEGI